MEEGSVEWVVGKKKEVFPDVPKPETLKGLHVVIEVKISLTRELFRCCRYLLCMI